MSPRCYPPQPEFGRGRTAERRVWEMLRDQLPGDAALLHSVPMIERGTEHEADLIIAWPGAGIAIVEVKGGHISRRHGQWYQSSGGETRPIKDPVVQAQDCKHVLHRLLVQHRSQAATARSAHLVAFPFTDIDPGWSYAGCPRDMILARNDLAAAAARIRAVIDRHGAGHAPLTGAGLESLLEVLEGQLPGQASLLSWAEENEAYVDQLTRDQAKVARILRQQRRLKVIGGAGTGKTWLALEQARHLAADGERVALVCYSRGLARFLQRMTAGWPARHRPAYVGLFHSLPLAWGADPPPDDPAQTSGYYEERLPAQMGELAASLSGKDKYDAIVVDEAQDFSAAWWPPTLACLRDQDTGGLYAFLDEAQRVFDRHGEVPIPLPPIVLDENIRNTRQIAQVFGSLGAAQARYRGMDGPPARFIPCPPDKAIDQADSQVDRLLGEGWEPGQIALLVTGTRHQLQKEILDYHGWDSYWDGFFAADEVFYGHVLGFKGLERPVVVLAVNGLRDESRGREYLYVGLSRARSCLVVCGDLDQIAAVGGAGLRRRLQASMERPVLYRAGEGSGRPGGDRAAWTIRGRSVSAMVMTNRDRIDRGMGYLASGLGPFVNELMAAAFPEGSDWVKVLAARNPSRYGPGYQYSLSDPRFLLRVVTEERRVFKDRLSRVEQGFATELRAAGNSWAHQEQFSDEDTYRTMDTMERLLAAVGAGEQASQVRRLRLDLQQPVAGSVIPSAGTHAARPGRPDQGRSHGTTGFWSAVGRADVVRATEEYDRLGQERFLAEHGFGRAIAYLLIHGGRSYDSKAILGVAYKFAMGIPIGPHEFSGGASGAAGVLRKLGFEVRDTRTPAGQRARDTAGPRTQARRHVPAPIPARSTQQGSAATLDGIAPERSLLVLTCSGRKERGGQPPYSSVDIAWPGDLGDARRQVLATAQADTAHVLPAWRRYTGAFYQYARPALADAVAAGHVVIISGGYGIVRGDEPIGWYDKVLQLADWPAGLLESALITEAQRCSAQTVVAFASATTEYTKLLRRTGWQQAGIDARLVTITGVTSGALREVPRRLGQAFSAFWNRQHDYPPGTVVEVLL